MTLVNADTGELVAELTPDEARTLTDRIRGSLQDVQALVVEAYQRRVVAVGSPSRRAGGDHLVICGSCGHSHPADTEHRCHPSLGAPPA